MKFERLTSNHLLKFEVHWSVVCQRFLQPNKMYDVPILHAPDPELHPPFPSPRNIWKVESQSIVVVISPLVSLMKQIKEGRRLLG